MYIQQIINCQQIKLVVFATVGIFPKLFCAEVSGKNIFYIYDCSLKKTSSNNYSKYDLTILLLYGK